MPSAAERTRFERLSSAGQHDLAEAFEGGGAHLPALPVERYVDGGVRVTVGRPS